MIGRTRIVWDDAYEEYKCEKCKAIMHCQFDFKYCPYCGSRVISIDERRAKTGVFSCSSVLSKIIKIKRDERM